MADAQMLKARKEFIINLENDLQDSESGFLDRAVIEWQALRSFGLGVKQVKEILTAGEKAGRFIISENKISTVQYGQRKTETP